jgi:hypothetical protein
MVTVAGPVRPAHDPYQPANCQPVAGVAVKVTLVVALKVAVQLPVQAMPVGTLVTVPWPLTIASRVYEPASGLGPVVKLDMLLVIQPPRLYESTRQ